MIKGFIFLFGLITGVVIKSSIPDVIIIKSREEAEEVLKLLN